MPSRRPLSEKVLFRSGEEIEPRFDHDAVPIFLGCDDKFLPHAMTTVASIMAHADPNIMYDIMIVQSGVVPDRMQKAVGWMRRFPNASLRFVDIASTVDALGEQYFSTTREYTVAVFFRVFAPEIFSYYDKIVYLDSDMILFGDVAELYRQDLDGMIVGACRDFVAERQSLENSEVGGFWRRELGMEPGEAYFNSGCLLMNLAGMRTRNTLDLILKKAAVISGSRLPDQDVLNSILQGQVRFLPPEWNCFDWMFDCDEESRNFQLVAPDCVAALRRARDNARVLHYVEKKPWAIGYMGKNAEHYWRYAAKTPFYRETARKLRADSGFLRVGAHILGCMGQELNFRLRSLFSSDTKRKRYEARIHNLGLRRRGALSQRRLARSLPESDTG